MKKITVTLLMTLLLFAASALYGCTGGGIGGGTAKEPELTPFVSYEESVFLAATGDVYNVEVVYLKSEDPKRADGKVASGLKKKVRVSYIPLRLGGIDETVEFRYLGVSGKLAKSPIKHELTAEFDTEFDPNAPQTELELKIGAAEEKISLTILSADAMSARDALTLATETLKDTLQTEITAGFQREILVKIVPDALGETPFYFYISFFAAPDRFSAVLIDPIAKKVVAKKP